MLRRPHYIVFSLVLLLALVLLNLPEKAASRLKLSVGSLFVPLFGLTTSAQNATEAAGNSIVPRKVLVAEMERLRRENVELQTQRLQIEEMGRENDRLRQQIQWQKQIRWRMKLARVVGRDSANWWRTIQIDLGSRDGVKENQPVLSSQGLVGRVSSVGLTRSQVLLIGDANCRVAALVQETRDNGVIAPLNGVVLDPTMVALTYLSRNTQLLPDQTVVTSGLGGIFPKGITIGKVIDSRTVGYGLYTEARVKLAVNVGQLEEVWVLWP